MLQSIQLDFVNSRVTYVDGKGAEGSFHLKNMKSLSPILIKLTGLEVLDDNAAESKLCDSRYVKSSLY